MKQLIKQLTEQIARLEERVERLEHKNFAGKCLRCKTYAISLYGGLCMNCMNRFTPYDTGAVKDQMKKVI